MKKLVFVATLVLTFVAILGSSTIAFADTSTDYTQTKTYQMLDEFLTQNPERSGELNEKHTATYILDKFVSYGLTPYNGNSVTNGLQTIPADYAGFTSYNAIAWMDSATDDCIVIGAHYDGVGEGANDNASGVVALLQIAQALASQQNLPFDVIFVGFGAEEQGLCGSQYFVDAFQLAFGRAWKNINVMFNIDAIANGDNLYVHCENKPTELANLILQNASGNAILMEKPHAVGVYNIDMWGYGYYETIQGSDHTPFRTVGIPVANFFAGNFQNWDFVESTTSNFNTMNTPLDTFQNLNNNRGGEWVVKIDTVVATVVSTVTHATFGTVSTNARNDLADLSLWYNPLWPKIAVFVILIVAVILAVLHHRKLQKQAIMGEAEVKTTRIFSTPDADDIFSFKK